jgi:hypothetical protein
MLLRDAYGERGMEAAYQMADPLQPLKPAEPLVRFPKAEIPTSSQSSSITVGELHNMIEEHYGKLGWTAFAQCWQQAAGIVEPIRSSPQSQCSEQNTDGKPDSPSRDGVTRSDVIDAGLLQAITQMADRLRNWMLRSPETETLPSETVAEREAREELDSIGGWPGV